MLTILNSNYTHQLFSSSPLGIMDLSLSTEEQAAASAVAALASDPHKRERAEEESPDRPSKMARGGAATGPNEEDEQPLVSEYSSSTPHVLPDATAITREGTPSSDPDSARTVKPYPYFCYRDFSSLPDPDPLVPLTSPGRVPNFPAKMHSILSRADLADVVAWNPHGRSWRVLKPREFEVKVIPTYFEHAKYSSFIRQANGWGFRRITQGRDRNSYYHEMFLRGLPHLCKVMKRPGVSEKQATDPEHEPDLFKISEEKPVPERAQDESILLQCTLQGGPKARMPICLGNLSKHVNSSPSTAGHVVPNTSSSPIMASMSAPQHAAPGTTYSEACHYRPSQGYPNGMAMMDNQSINNTSYAPTQQENHQQHQTQNEQTFLPQSAYMPSQSQAPAPITAYGAAPAPGTQQNHVVVTPSLTYEDTTLASPLNPMSVLMPAAFQGNSAAAAQFAAGFAAATALSNTNFREIFGQALASFPPNGNNNGGNVNGQQQQQVAPVQQQMPPQQYQCMMVPQAQPLQGQNSNHYQQQQQHQQVVHMKQQHARMPQYVVPSAHPQPQTIQ